VSVLVETSIPACIVGWSAGTLIMVLYRKEDKRIRIKTKNKVFPDRWDFTKLYITPPSLSFFSYQFKQQFNKMFLFYFCQINYNLSKLKKD
jgi:hypothetical protein